MGRDPTHQEWLLWGQVLYDSLMPADKADWPLYYKDMVADGLRPSSPDPLINIWKTPPAPTSQLLSQQPFQDAPSTLPSFKTTPQNSPLPGPVPLQSFASLSPISRSLHPKRLSSPHLSGPCKEQPSLSHTFEPSKNNTDYAQDLSAMVIEEATCHANSIGWGQLKMSEEIAKRISLACPNNIKCDAGADTYLVSEYVGTFWVGF